jgi:hypothetical protein
VQLVKRAPGEDGRAERILRDPAVLTDLLLSAAQG